MSEKFYPFSNGSQFNDWQDCNCERCKKYDQNQADPKKCEIDFEIGMAYLGDGSVDEDIARRMGFIDNPEAYVWKCPEVDWTDEWMNKCKQKQNNGVTK